MSDTTSITDLPTDPTNGGNITNNPVSIEPTSQINQQPLDQVTITQLVNGLQQAINSGSTQLPSRDIPMTTSSHSSDPYTQPNYVPPPPQNNSDYIKDYESSSNMINSHNKQSAMNNSLDEMYNELQTPLLLGVLYFLFQLPFFKRFLSIYFKALINNDGNYNLTGYVFCSILFGLIFYIFNKLITIFM
jgi:hypothetical protein